LGETGLPIRLNALPEIVLVTLEKENNPAVGKDEEDDGQ
jgi:hypothetical protein